MKCTISNNTSNSTASLTDVNSSTNSSSSVLFYEQVQTVSNLFEKWNDCERTVVIYALLKRLRYSSLKFIQYSIESNLSQNLDSQSNLCTVVIDINANNPSYLQNLFNAYKTSQVCDWVDTSSCSSSDKESMPFIGSDYQLINFDERNLHSMKVNILNEFLNMLPLLKPGNEGAKFIYLKLIPIAVRDTMRNVVPAELVQQIFSYLLIHPAITNDERKSLNVWLRQLEEYIQSFSSQNCYYNENNLNQKNIDTEHQNTDNLSLITSSSVTSYSSSASCSSVSNVSISSSMSNPGVTNASSMSKNSNRNTDWQTIAPPSKQHNLTKSKTMSEWSTLKIKPEVKSNNDTADNLCDDLNGIKLNELYASQTTLGLSMGNSLINQHSEPSALVNGVAAAACVSVSMAPRLFSNNTNAIISIISNNNNINCDNNANRDDHDNSFSKNGTEVMDFEPNVNVNSCESCISSIPNLNQSQLDLNRWSLDGKLTALKTRRSNSLTTQTISTSSSSSNSSVITVNDNCSNSSENLSQIVNKPRSFSLSIEYQRGALTNSGSDTRLDDFKPNYIKFQTQNVGMSNIGLWLKSLRLHKYIDLFKNISFEEMLQITEEYLQSVGVTKGASHKLALCIEKLKERFKYLVKLETELINNQLKLQTAVEELASIVLTPMKPVELVKTKEENVALQFLKLTDLVCTLIQKETHAIQDDETLSIILWILDRSIHNEAFMNHVNQLKELKLKISKLKMSVLPKMLHVKNVTNNVLNKPRWTNKSRKCETKNSSSDRINQRKNSNDTVNFSFSCLQQQNIHNGHQTLTDYEKYHILGNNNSNSHYQRKSSSYPNFINNHHHQQQHAIKQQQSQFFQHQQQQQHMQQQIFQNTHFPPLPQHQQHRRSLNNLIVVSARPQQRLMYKHGQPNLTDTKDNTKPENTLQNQQESHTTKSKMTTFPNFSSQFANMNISNEDNNKPQKKTMAAVVLVSSDEMNINENTNAVNNHPPQILINSNSNILSNNLMCQQQQNLLQQQHQLKLLAAAAAAVGSSCNNNRNNKNNCLCVNGSYNSNKNNSNSSCNNCSLTSSQYESTATFISKLNVPSIKEKCPTNAAENLMNDIKSLEQLETLCLQMTEQAIN